MNDTSSGKVKKQGVFKTSLLVINLISAFLLLLSQVAPGVSPARFWVLELLAISYPFLLLLNVCMVIYWLLRFHRFVLISAIVIIMGYDKINQLYRPNIFSIDVPPTDNAIKIMSYNVRLFDLYNWTGNMKTRAKIFQLIDKVQPTILCFQEYYHTDNPQNHFSNNDTISKILKNAYCHTEYGITLRKTDHWGLATFSKYPIVGGGKVFYVQNKSNFGMYSDILIDSDTIRVYNVHFQSNHFKEEDYVFLENPDSGSNERILNGAHNIVSRLKRASIRRSLQVDELYADLQTCKYPYIICGDFNDPPFSYTYESISKNLKDAFVEKGKGFGLTYTESFAPYRIDYILHQKEFDTYKFDIIKSNLSDHYPIVAWLEYKKKLK